MSAPLYTLEVLRLAASVANFPRLANATSSAERRSPTCGSRVTVDVLIGKDGKVAAIGEEVRACALGQAGAALLAEHAIGRTADEIGTASRNLRAFLHGERDDPGSWPGLDILAAARPHRARHASILLAFEAAAEAASANAA